MNVMNLREFAPGLYAAGQPTPRDWPEIAKAGIRTVLNLRPESEHPCFSEAELARAAGLEYLYLPIGSADMLDDERVAAFHALLASHAEGGMLIHCGTGNRAGALVALRAHRYLGAPVEAALAAGRQAGLTGLEPYVRELLERQSAG